MLNVQSYLRRPMLTLAAIATDPIESWMWFVEQYAVHREGHAPAHLYQAQDDWERHLHRLTGFSLPAEAASEFWSLWSNVMGELNAKGIRPGPESFKTWNDGDAAFVRAIWYLTRYLRPQRVVETGVAHGVTSRFILEALKKNGCGRLWSIDRPPMEPEWQNQIGMAVGSELRDRWTYIRGSSRRRLPPLLSRLGEIDLFIHDSLHSERNVRFEIDHAWMALRPGGAVVVDDIDANRGFQSFCGSLSGHHFLVCEAEPIRPDLRRFNEKGLFGIVLKDLAVPNEH